MSQESSLTLPHAASPARLVGFAFVTILLAHWAVDCISALLPSTLGLIEARLGLSAKQSAWLLGLGPLSSGLAQPLCALASDRLGTRQLGVLGVALGFVGMALLGRAESLASLAVCYTVGMVGIGMFHPIGASTLGQLWHERRTTAMSCFFVTGMVGGVVGALVWPRVLASGTGFDSLPLIIVPGMLLVAVFQRSLSGLEPLHTRRTSAPELKAPRANWAQVAILYVSAVLRFCVNMSLLYLFVRWVQGHVAAQHSEWDLATVAKSAAPRVGNLNAAMLTGMGIGGLSAGLLVRPGKEKWPLVLVPLVFAPVIALFPFLPLEAGYALAIVAGIGFAATIPVTIAMAQQLLPQHTNLASSLMMGGAWAVALLGPRFAEFGVANFGLPATFLATAAALALAGLVCLPITNQSA